MFHGQLDVGTSIAFLMVSRALCSCLLVDILQQDRLISHRSFVESEECILETNLIIEVSSYHWEVVGRNVV